MRDHPFLESKGEKVSMGKYQQTVMNAKRTPHLFALKGFYYGIACRKLGYKTLPAPAAKTGKVTNAAPSAGPEHAAGSSHGAVTMKQMNVTEDAISLNAQNQLERAGIWYNQVENFHKGTIATVVLTHTAEYHSAQAKQLRDIPTTLAWERRQLKGEWSKHIRLTVMQIGYVQVYPNCGIDTSWREMHVDTQDPRIEYADDRAGLLWDMAFGSVREWEQRTLQYQCSPIWRKALLLDKDINIRQEFIDTFKSDCDNWDELNKIDAAWAVPFRQRSVWQRRIATQFKMCLAADGGVVTARLVQLARNQTVRFISQLCVEEMFNRVKSNVGGSVNTRCTAQRAMAVAIDTGVLSTINRFNEVSRESQILDRGFEFDKNAFKPALKPSQLDEATRAANFTKIVGYGEADWFSPSATNSAAPFCDILASRDVKGDMGKLETAWLCRLASSSRLLLRRVGTPHWVLPVGDICAVIVKVWPVDCIGDAFEPRVSDTTTTTTITITNPTDWEAVMVKPMSPMRQATRIESAAGNKLVGNIVRIKQSSAYGRLPVRIRFNDKPRPLLQTVCRGGFANQTLTFLVKLATYLEAECGGRERFDLVTGLAITIIPIKEMTDELMEEIIDLGGLSFEHDEDYEEIASLEYVLDCFGKQERTNLSYEVKSAKEIVAEKCRYKDAATEWKVNCHLGLPSFKHIKIEKCKRITIVLKYMHTT